MAGLWSTLSKAISTSPKRTPMLSIGHQASICLASIMAASPSRRCTKPSRLPRARRRKDRLSISADDLALESFGHHGQYQKVGAVINFSGFVLKLQRSQPVGDEILYFHVVGRRGLQLSDLHQGLFVGELFGLKLIDQHNKCFLILPITREAAVLMGSPVSGSSKTSMVNSSAFCTRSALGLARSDFFLGILGSIGFRGQGCNSNLACLSGIGAAVVDDIAAQVRCQHLWHDQHRHDHGLRYAPPHQLMSRGPSLGLSHLRPRTTHARNSVYSLANRLK